MKHIFLFSLAILLATSCVPATKFKTLQGEKFTCEEERNMLKGENEELKIQNKELAAKLARAEKQLDKAGRDTLQWQQEVNNLRRQNAMLSKDYDDLKEAQQALMKGSEDEIRRLMSDLQSSQIGLQQREAELNTRKSDLDKVQRELEQRNARLAELEKVLSEQQSMVGALRKKVSDALLGFENQGLTITQKNGKVYVSLDEKLLFKSGSTVVDPKGVSALKKLAGVLEQNPDINVMIEGHTDDVGVLAGSAYKDNWDLSVLRATSIVRILLDGSSINPQRLTTAGRSQYQPVDPAKTPEARQKNRRTEIILTPKLEELFKLIE